MAMNKRNLVCWSLSLAVACVVVGVWGSGCDKLSIEPAASPDAAEDVKPAESPGPAAAAPPKTLAGDWVSVDFVRSFDDFKPGRKSWQGDLFLTEFRAEVGGGTSLGWTWTEGSVTHSNGTTRFPYLIKEIDGTSYLFLPWLSGDVTERGQQPSYYVMV